jgi:hypothetical protein
MATNLEAVCRDATRDGIHEAIVALKEVAYQATGGGLGKGKGFRNGEAEKIISQVSRSSPWPSPPSPLLAPSDLTLGF